MRLALTRTTAAKAARAERNMAVLLWIREMVRVLPKPSCSIDADQAIKDIDRALENRGLLPRTQQLRENLSKKMDCRSSAAMTVAFGTVPVLRSGMKNAASRPGHGNFRAPDATQRAVLHGVLRCRAGAVMNTYPRDAQAWPAHHALGSLTGKTGSGAQYGRHLTMA
jgi:hypothetical protein